jgi:hypothetical protein
MELQRGNEGQVKIVARWLTAQPRNRFFSHGSIAQANEEEMKAPNLMHEEYRR